MRRKRVGGKISAVLAILAAAVFLTGPAGAGGPSFQGLGFLGTYSNANGVSADGAVVCAGQR